MRWRAVLLAVLGLAACSPETAPPEPARPVRVITAVPADMAPSIVYSGAVVPRVETDVGLRVAGRLTHRFVEVGETVAVGAPLAELDATVYRLQVREAEAALAAAEADARQAKADRERYAELWRRAVVAHSEFERREAASRMADARLDQALSRLSIARNNLDDTHLTAPEAGVVTQVTAEAGQVVAVGQPVLKLARLLDREVAIDVPENHVRALAPGAVAEVALWDDDTKRWPAVVREIAPQADPATRTYRVRVAPTKGADALRFGMTALVRFPGDERKGVAVPMSALFQDGREPAVWVLSAGRDKVVLRRVRLGRLGETTAVIEEGLEAGEVVVAAGVHRLDAGEAVRVWDGRWP